VTVFVEAVRLTPFHDDNLQRCTKELNAILAEFNSKSMDPTKELRLCVSRPSFLVVVHGKKQIFSTWFSVVGLRSALHYTASPTVSDFSRDWYRVLPSLSGLVWREGVSGCPR
jgi:hypothetical protein